MSTDVGQDGVSPVGLRLGGRPATRSQAYTREAPTPFGARSSRHSWVRSAKSAGNGWGFELLSLMTVGFAVPIAVACHYGSISAPVSDDWAYDLSAYRLAFHGQIDLYHWATIDLIGQLFLALPVLWIFGPHVWVLNVWTCLIGVAGLVAVAYLGRCLHLPRRHALFVALLMGAGPMWAVLSTSFMTDITSVSVMAIALAVAAGDDRTGRVVGCRTVVALAVAGLAFTIREPTGVAFVAIAVCRLRRSGPVNRRSMTRWAAVVVPLAAALLAFYLWRRALSSGSVERPGDWSAYSLAAWWYDDWLFPLLGLVMVPIAVLMRPADLLRRAMTTCRGPVLLAWLIMPVGPVAIYTAVALGLFSERDGGLASGFRAPPLGNSFFDASGFPDPGVGHQYLPNALLWSLALMALGSTFVVVAAVVLGLRRWAARSGQADPSSDQSHHVAVMLCIVAAGSFLVWVLLLGSGRLMWDRYLLPGVMPAALVFLYLARRLQDEVLLPTRSWRYGMVTLAGLAILSLAVTVADDGYTGTQWRYSNQFAASVQPTPKRLISTDWTWSSVQNQAVTALIPGYAPCYIENIDSPERPGDIDYRRGGSWVDPYTYSMSAGTSFSEERGCRWRPRT